MPKITCKFVLIAFFCIISVTGNKINAQPGILWVDTIKTGPDGYGNAVKQTLDGGFVLAGKATNPIPGTGADGLITRMDPDGTIIWSKLIGGKGHDEFRDMIQTYDGGILLDGGYILVGTSNSEGTKGIWVVRTDRRGNTIWSKTFGRTASDYAAAIEQTVEGNYFIAGSSYNNSLKQMEYAALIIDKSGNLLKERYMGEARSQYYVKSGCAAPDGSYILTGSNMTPYLSYAWTDFTIKLDKDLNEIFSKGFMELKWPAAAGFNSIIVTSDGDYVATGSEAYYLSLFCLDSNGKEKWLRQFNGIDNLPTIGLSVQQTSDGGFILAGTFHGAGYYPNTLIIKTDNLGHEQWRMTEEYNRANCIRQTSDGGFIMTASNNTAGDNSTYVLRYGRLGLKVENSFASPSDTVLVPVSVSFPMGYSINSVEFSIGNPDNKYIKFVDVVTDGCLMGAYKWAYDVNNSDPAEINVASAGDNTIKSDGIFCKLKFAVARNAGGNYPLEVQNVIFNTGTIGVDITDGIISVAEIAFGDVDRNGYIQAYDAFYIIKYLAGQQALDTKQLKNANVSYDTTVSALDAGLILKYCTKKISLLPFDGPASSMAVTGSLRMNELVPVKDDLIEVPLFIDSLKNLLSFEGTFNFNPADLTYKDIIWSEDLTGFNISVNAKSGQLIFAGAGTFPLTGGLELCRLRFTRSGDLKGKQSVISLASIRLNESDVLKNSASSTVSELTAVESRPGSMPSEYALDQNFPNPFNPVTAIKYQLPENTFVTLAVYDILGREIVSLVNEEKPAGVHIAEWNGCDNNNLPVSSGIYLYKLTAGNFTSVKKMNYLK